MENIKSFKTPNLYIVGFQKCGSSSLFDLLCQHPSITGSVPKETFCLVDDDDPHFVKDKNVTSKYFTWESYYDKSVINSKYILEASVCNFYQETALDYIKNVNNTKVIFILRDPVNRFRSCYDYYSPKSNQTIKDINHYIEILTNPEQKDKLSYDGAKHSLEHGKYSQYIKSWLKYFEAKNVYIIIFEKLIQDPKREITKISKFLDLDFSSIDSLPHKNQTNVIKNRNLHFWLKRNLPKVGLSRFKLLLKLYNTINTNTNKSGIDEKSLKWLKLYYREEYDWINSLDNKL